MQIPTEHQRNEDTSANEEFAPIEAADRPAAERQYGADFEDDAMEARHG